MTAPGVRGIDLFKIAGRSISGWIPSLKTGNPRHVRQPFCSQLEERLLMYLEYHPRVAWYARGDISAQFAATYRLPMPKQAPFAIGYVFEGKPHDYLPDVVGTLTDGRLFIAEAGLEDEKRQPETMWLQFRRRLDRLHPFCRIAGHTSEEVREILAALETVYREPFPQLNLRQWSRAIYTWLTHSLLDPTSSGRVVMDYVMKFVTTALEWSYAAGETDVRAETLQAAAELLTLRRDAIRMVDGAGPAREQRPPEQEQESVIGAEAGGEPGSPRLPKRRRKKNEARVVEGGETREHTPSNVQSETPARLVGQLTIEHQLVKRIIEPGKPLPYCCSIGS